MQFSLRTLFILTAAICVYCAILNAPQFIAIPIFCAVAWLLPAYWIAGVVYAREAKRAFFIGGLSAGAVPFAALVFFSLVLAVDGPWRWGRNMGRYELGETQIMNLIASLIIFAPAVLAFLGGWISRAVYFSLQPAKPAPPPLSPFRPATPAASGAPRVYDEIAPGGAMQPATSSAERR